MQSGTRVYYFFTSSHSEFGTMPCRHCNEWVHNEWLFWRRPFWYATWLPLFRTDTGWFFICERCEVILREFCGRCGRWTEYEEQVFCKQCVMEAWPDGVSYVNYILCEACHGNIEGHNSVSATTESNYHSPDDDNPWLGLLE